MYHLSDPNAARIAHTVKNELAGRITDPDYYRRRQNFRVHVYTDMSPTRVIIQGPRHVQDDTLRVALSEYGYEPHDHLHRDGDGRTKETLVTLYNE